MRSAVASGSFPILALILVCTSLANLFGTRAAAQPSGIGVGERHLVIIREGMDAIWGSYVFAVRNNTSEEVEFTTPVMLPKETEDFRPQEGVTPEQLILDEESGGISISRSFPPGMTLVSIGFVVPGRFGKGAMTFEPRAEILDFTLLVPSTSKLIATAPNLKKLDDDANPDKEYIGYRIEQSLAAGKPYKIDVLGLPEGRARWWFVGGTCGVFMFVVALVLAWRTRPKESGQEGDMVLSG